MHTFVNTITLFRTITLYFIMRLFLFTLFLTMLVPHCSGQDSFKIVGRWRVVGMDNGVNFDYKAESYTVNKSLSNTLCGRLDSAKVVKEFLNWALSCSNCFYIFGSDNSYKEYREEDIRSERSFQLKPGQKKMNVYFLKDGRSKKVTYKYELLNEKLFLYVPSFFIKDKIEITLEKQ